MGESAPAFFSPAYPGLSQDQYRMLRETPLSLWQIQSILEKCDPDALHLEDHLVEAIWQQELLRTKALLQQAGVDDSWDNIQAYWKEHFIREMQNNQVSDVRFSLLAHLLPGRGMVLAIPEERATRIGEALEAWAGQNPYAFQIAVQKDMLLAFAHGIVADHGYMFSENCTRNIIRAALPSLREHPLDQFQDIEAIDWNEDEQQRFSQRFLYYLSRELIQEPGLYPAGDSLLESTYAEAAYENALWDALHMYLVRLRERDDFEERMGRMMGDDWKDHKEQLSQRLTSEQIPAHVSSRLRVGLRNTEEFQLWARGQISTEEMFRRAPGF